MSGCREAMLLSLRMLEGPQAKECGQTLEAAKGKDTDFLLELPEGIFLLML
jgi:hypothetical protein